jgi:MarR family transcriptional regulator for hemolysin
LQRHQNFIHVFADAPSRDRLGFLMVTLTRQWRRFVEEQLAASGLTDATWTPLLHLRAWGDGVTQKELAERVGWTAPAWCACWTFSRARAGWNAAPMRPTAAASASFLTAGNCAVDSTRATHARGRARLLQDLEDSEVEAMLDGQQDSRPHRADDEQRLQVHPGTEERMAGRTTVCWRVPRDGALTAPACASICARLLQPVLPCSPPGPWGWNIRNGRA